jgi:hypothetical protein
MALARRIVMTTLKADDPPINADDFRIWPWLRLLVASEVAVGSGGVTSSWLLTGLSGEVKASFAILPKNKEGSRERLTRSPAHSQGLPA